MSDISDILQHSIEARISALATRQGVLRPRDVEAVGIPREYLLRLMRRGVVERTGRGLYRMANSPFTENHSLAEVATRLPSATICLLTALVFHGMTTQIPREVWIALQVGSRPPRNGGQKIRTVHFSGPAFLEGRINHRIEGVAVSIYSPAKTVADCFKFRNKIGLDVALEALRECVSQQKGTIAQIRKYAAICRVARIIQPYLDSLK